jgi:hypothetical protein
LAFFAQFTSDLDLPMQNAQQFARNGLPIRDHELIVNSSMQGNDQLVAILLDDETDELLCTTY